MNSAINIHKKKANPFLIHIIVSVLTPTLLLFVDEGQYNLEWMKDKETMLYFSFGIMFMIAGQTIMDKFILKKYLSPEKIWITSVVGLLLGTASFIVTLVIIDLLWR